MCKRFFAVLLMAFFISGLGLETAHAGAYPEYDTYVKRPSSEAGNKFYHGAKYEPKTGAYLGMFGEGDRSMHDFNAPAGGWYLNKTPEVTGKDHAVYMLYLHYDTNLDHYDRHYQEAKRLGKAMQLCIEPTHGLAEVKDDAHLHNMARMAKEADIPIFLRFASEFNDPSNAWHKDGAAMYREKFALIARVMHAEAPNVVMCWCPNDWPIDNAYTNSFYPGDEYVDWVGVSSYPPFLADGAPKQGNTWLDRFREIYDMYGSRKPIYITEGAAIASVEYNPNIDVTPQAAYEIERFYAGAARRYPNLKMIIYWSNDEPWSGLRHCALGNNPPVLNAYKKAIQDPYYLGQFQTSSNIYYEPVKNVTLNGQEVVSALANDVRHRVGKAVYYVNGTYVGEGAFPSFETTINFSPWAGQRIQLKTEFYSDQNVFITSRVIDVMVGNATPAPEIKIELNGKPLTLKDKPILENGRTYLPMRALAEQVLNANVQWDAQTNTATISGTIDRTYDLKDGNCRVINGRTYLPLRQISEEFGLKIDWNGNTHTVSVHQ